MDNKATIDKQVEWNLAQALSVEIAKMRELSNKYFIARNLQSSAEALICLRLTSTHVFSEEQLEELLDLEKELLTLISKSQKEVIGFGLKEEIKQKAIARTELYLKFIEYNNKLTKLLDFYGFLGNRKADKTKLVA